MNTRWQTALFWLMAFIFVFGGTSIVFYSQGWRLDTSSWTPQKVGAIYVRSFPKDVQIFLDDEEIENDSWFLGNGTLINGLYPKNYHLRLVKEGYRSWDMRLFVEPMKVAEVKYALLIPEESENLPSLPPRDTQKFSILPEPFSFKYLTSDSLQIDSWKMPPGDIAFTSLDGRLVVRSSPGKYTLHFPLDNSSTSIQQILKNSGFSGAIRFFQIPGEYNRALISDADSIGIMDFERMMSSSYATTSAKTTGILISDIAAANGSSLAFAARKATSSVVYILNRNSPSNIQKDFYTIPGEPKRVSFSPDGRLIILDSNEDLYTANLIDKKSDRIASKVKDFEFLEDGSRVAVLERESIEIVSFLKGYKERDYRRFRLPGQENIKGLIWHKDGQHLFVNYGNYVKLLDLNDTNLDNYQKVADCSHFEYSEEENTLYCLESGRISYYQFEE